MDDKARDAAIVGLTKRLERAEEQIQQLQQEELRRKQFYQKLLSELQGK